MGYAGTDVASDAADVALLADDLTKLVEVLKLARRSQRVVTENIVLSVLVISILMVGAAEAFFPIRWLCLATRSANSLSLPAICGSSDEIPGDGYDNTSRKTWAQCDCKISFFNISNSSLVSSPNT